MYDLEGGHQNSSGIRNNKTSTSMNASILSISSGRSGQSHRSSTRFVGLRPLTVRVPRAHLVVTDMPVIRACVIVGQEVPQRGE